MLKHIHVVQPGRMSVVYLGGSSNYNPSDESLLEDVFANWNSGSGKECGMFLSSGTRSLSVGDFVGLDGKFYQCKAVGWVEVPRGTVNVWCENVEARMRETDEDSWSALNHFLFVMGR